MTSQKNVQRCTGSAVKQGEISGYSSKAYTFLFKTGGRNNMEQAKKINLSTEHLIGEGMVQPLVLLGSQHRFYSWDSTEISQVSRPGVLFLFLLSKIYACKMISLTMKEQKLKYHFRKLGSRYLEPDRRTVYPPTK